jgi:hypothetical protein
MAPVIAPTQLVIDWISSIGWNTMQETGYPLYPPPILDEPDQSVWLTMTGGPGFVTEEGGLDAVTFQLMTRGPSDDPFSPEVAAKTLDQMILAAAFPVTIDGVTISHAHRLAGPPAALPVDPADLRHTFTCNYIVIMGQ